MGIFESLRTNHDVGCIVTNMHAYRFREPHVLSQDVLRTEISETGSLSLEEVYPVIYQIEKLANYEIALTGGWATLIYTNRTVRPTSSDLDFYGHSLTITRTLDTFLNLKYVPEWECRTGTFNLDNGKTIRIDLKSFDILPPCQLISTGNQPSIKIVTPEVVVLGKLNRSLSRGAKERDQLDISALLLSGSGPLILNKLIDETRNNKLVWEAWEKLDLPNSVKNKFSNEEVNSLYEYSQKIIQFGKNLNY